MSDTPIRIELEIPEWMELALLNAAAPDGIKIEGSETEMANETGSPQHIAEFVTMVLLIYSPSSIPKAYKWLKPTLRKLFTESTAAKGKSTTKASVEIEAQMKWCMLRVKAKFDQIKEGNIEEAEEEE